MGNKGKQRSENAIPDYYAILDVSTSASSDEISQAYRRLALVHHPDRNPNDPQATQRFQFIADAYAILSDSNRRRLHDNDRRTRPLYNPLDTSSSTAGQSTASDEYQAFTNAQETFNSVFEEMLTPELGGNANGYFWQPIGGASGAALGFIFANIPGLIGGYALGSWAGAVRDKKGKSVMEVFNELPQKKKAEVLTALLKKLFGLDGLPKGK
jgi:curved DNA-binding protein CbpA